MGDGRRPRLPRAALAAWSAARRAAVARLHAEPRVDPRDLAEAVGVRAALAPALFEALGLPRRPGPEIALSTALDAVGAADAPTLRAHLRAHIARQIAAFDAALKGEGAAVLDSARVLRDLGGLKRLFDDVVRDGEGHADGGDGEPDLPALRAEIARRARGFVGERPAP